MAAVLRTRHQELPSAREGREALREKGQFWTPAWVAEAMVHYAVDGCEDSIFDPAVGEGAFFRAAKAVSQRSGQPLRLLGTEIDPLALHKAKESGLTSQDLAGVTIGDFLSTAGPGAGPIADAPTQSLDTNGLLPAIVANPPYIRHHRLSQETKKSLKDYGRRLIGAPLDGRAGYHVYFLLHALTRLKADGRLAFIMPADTVEGVFSSALWSWITAHYRLEAVITFAPEATPFPGVDTNAVVFMIRNAGATDWLWWARCRTPETDHLKNWVRSGFTASQDGILEIHRRTIAEGLATGLSRHPEEQVYHGPRLSDFASVVRGIATGDNHFFFLTKAQARGLGIPEEFLVRAIGRTRDLIGDASEVTKVTLDALDDAGRPTYLLSLDGRPLNEFPISVRRYLEQGTQSGVPEHALIGMRKPWYKMEVRRPPDFLFAYLGRRNVRFIRNSASIVPLTGFLCVYARPGVNIEALWTVLNHPDTIANLARVGKSYGDGAIKVEPRALDRLPIPPRLAQTVGLFHDLPGSVPGTD